jgi:ankyrin repeat protein
MSVDPKTQSLFAAIEAADYHLVKLIVDSGVALNSPNDGGLTPLAAAYRQGDMSIVKLLVTAGAELQASPSNRTTTSVVRENSYLRTENPQPSESPVRTDRLSQKDLVDFLKPSHPATPTAKVEVQPITPNHQDRREANGMMPAEAWQRAEAEATYTFDLDEIFDDSDRTLTSLTPPEIAKHRAPNKSAGDVEEGETYAIDLDFGSGLAGGMSAGDVEEGETYAIDLDFGSGLAGGMSAGDVEEGETYAIDLDFGSGLGGGMSAGDVEEGETYAIDLDFGSGLAGGMSAGDVEEGETYAIDLDVSGELNRDIADRAFKLPSPHLPPDLSEESTVQIDAPLGGNKTLLPTQRSLASPPSPPSTYDENATNSALMSAVIDNDLELVQQAIARGTNPNRYDWELSYAPLGMAIERGHVDIVRFLLAMGANPHSGSLSTTALGLAAQSGESEIIKLLLTMGVDVNTPVDRDGATPLMYAVKSGDLTTVQTLIAVGADPNVWVGTETPILIAAAAAHQDIYQYLYALVSAEIKHCADRDGEESIQTTLKRRLREQNRPVEKLIALATEGNLEEVKGAIELGIDIDAIGSQGHNALMAAAYYGHIPVLEALLAAAANPNLLSDGNDTWGHDLTALAIAASSFFASNRHEVVKLLVAGGADVNQQCAGGKTALMYAALAGSGYRACIQALIGAGADLDLRDEEGNTVLMLVAAAGNQSLHQMLCQAGASTVGMESIQLIQSATAGDKISVQALLTKGGINLNFDRGAALNCAVRGGHREVVKLLIDAGANVNLCGRSGTTPLAKAAYAGDAEIFRLLIQAGADIHLRTGNTRLYSCLEYAQMGLYRTEQAEDRQHAEIIRMLQQLGAR